MLTSEARGNKPTVQAISCGSESLREITIQALLLCMALAIDRSLQADCIAAFVISVCDPIRIV